MWSKTTSLLVASSPGKYICLVTKIVKIAKAAAPKGSSGLTKAPQPTVVKGSVERPKLVKNREETVLNSPRDMRPARLGGGGH